MPRRRWSVGEGPALLPPSTTEEGMPSGPPSKQRPSPLQRRVTCLIRGLGAAAANAAVGSEELIVLRLKFLGSLSSVELDKG